MTNIVKVPDEICVTVLRGGSTKGVQGVAFFITALVPHKNNYTIGPNITNMKGVARFTRAELENQIQLSKQHVPMDYASDIDEIQAIQLKVVAPEQVNGIISASKLWGAGVPEWRLSKKIKQQLKNIPRGTYNPASVTIPQSDFKIKLQINIRLQN